MVIYVRTINISPKKLHPIACIEKCSIWYNQHSQVITGHRMAFAIQSKYGSEHIFTTDFIQYWTIFFMESLLNWDGNEIDITPKKINWRTCFDSNLKVLLKKRSIFDLNQKIFYKIHCRCKHKFFPSLEFFLHHFSRVEFVYHNLVTWVSPVRANDQPSDWVVAKRSALSYISTMNFTFLIQQPL